LQWLPDEAQDERIDAEIRAALAAEMSDLWWRGMLLGQFTDVEGVGRYEVKKMVALSRCSRAWRQ
jgi:hypothetical protein